MYQVLLVDDEEMVTQGLSRFVPWGELGFEVVGTASSADKALDFLKSHPVHLVITDVMMPVKTGLDLIEAINAEYPSVKTVILSGYSDFAYAQQAVRLGAMDYLTKPINFTAIRQLLTRVHEKLDQENLQSGENDQLRQTLTRAVLMNLANGFPMEETKIAQYLDTDCAITVLRIAGLDKKPLPGDLISDLRKTLAPCQMVSPAEGEILCILEGKRDQMSICTDLEHILALIAVGGVSLCVGISEEFSGYLHLHLASVQAAKAMRYQKARSTAGVTLYSRMRAMYLNLKESTEQQITSLVTTLSTPDRRGYLLEEFNSVFSSLEVQPDFSTTTAQRFCTELLVEVDGVIREQLPQEYAHSGELSEILMEILSQEKPDQVRQRMVEHLQKILEDMIGSDETVKAIELIDRVKHYIQEHFAENLTLAVLSNVFFVCPAYLSRLFKKKTGINFVDYLTNLRMEKAKEFLANPAMKVYTVAEMVGYENPRYFSRIFKDATGMSPQDYRTTVCQTPEL